MFAGNEEGVEECKHSCSTSLQNIMCQKLVLSDVLSQEINNLPSKKQIPSFFILAFDILKSSVH